MSSDPPSVRRILETALYVEDLDRAEAFYRRLFRFERLLKDERMCALAIPGGQVLLLFRKGGSTQPSPTPYGLIPPHDAQGRQHLCFRIEREDVDVWRDLLTQEGVEVESRLHWADKDATSLYFRDPDGHSLEVGTSGLWRNDPHP